MLTQELTAPSRPRRAAAGLLLAITGAIASPGAFAQETTELDVLVAHDRTTTFYGMFVAEALGYFEDENLSINWLSSGTTVPYVAFLANGDADLVMMDAAEIYQAANAGQPIAVVYEDMQFAPEAIFVSENSEIQSLSDLDGKTIGLASDRDRLTVEIALDTVGLTLDDVQTAVVGDAGPTLANAFRRQTVDAVAGGQTELRMVEAAGIPLRNITPPEVSENPANSFVVWKPRIDEMRTEIEGFLRAWAKGMEAGSIDKEVTAAIMANAIPEQWEDPEVGMALLDFTVDVLHRPLTDQRGALMPEVWQRVKSRFVDAGNIDADLDPATFLDPSFTDAVNQFDEAEIEADLRAWKEENSDMFE